MDLPIGVSKHANINFSRTIRSDLTRPLEFTKIDVKALNRGHGRGRSRASYIYIYVYIDQRTYVMYA